MHMAAELLSRQRAGRWGNLPSVPDRGKKKNMFFSKSSGPALGRPSTLFDGATKAPS